ncbi:MAG: allantoinase AllB [Clostridiaceae bacterium]|nr:allantoinase AllB [Eubacteriales bacterium]
MIWDHIITNGTVVTSAETFQANIYVKNGKIAAITNEEVEGEALEVTDARGLYVLPGLIDAHVHSRDGYHGPHHKEDFFHSSMAGAAGGITTIFEMPNANPAVYSVETMNQLIECITPKAHVDFGVWGLSLGELNRSEILPLAKAGVVGFKFFWGYAIDSKNYQLIYNYQEGMENVIPPLDEGEIYCIFREVQKTGKLIAIHAENFSIINKLTAEVKKEGGTDYEAFLRSRPPLSELTVIQTAISLSRELHTRLHILHLAAGDGVELIRRARAEGLSVTAETCPHYLALTDRDYAVSGSLLKGYPPVRTKYDQDLLWKGLADGAISCVSSDHAPHTPEEKKKDLWSAPAGMTNIETMAPILLNAVNEGKLTINRMADVMSTQQAKLYGVYPRKGAILPGSDADFTLVDLNAEHVVDQEKLHSRTKLTPFHGRKLKGKVAKTILRGKTIACDGEITAQPFGRFVKACTD